MRGRGLLTLCALLAGSAPVSAQLASASTAALGMGDNFSAAARALNAVYWNPAGLGQVGGEVASLTLLTMRGSSGIDPVSLSDLARFGGDVVPLEVKEDWITRIEAHGGQAGSGTVEATWAAFHVRRFGAQFSTTSSLTGALSPGIARLVMFGNVGADGEPRAMSLDGSSFLLHAYSTAAASYAQPIDLGASRLSFGVTAKYTWGHLLAMGQHSEGAASADPLAVDLTFPLVQTRLDPDSLRLNSGGGYGLDVGASWHRGAVTVSAVVRNILSGFAWQVSELQYRPLSLSFHEDQVQTDTEPQGLDAAPQSVRAMVADLRFNPVFAAGAAFSRSNRLLLTADVRFTEDGGMVAGPTRHVGAGAQVRPLGWLPLRAGAAAIELGQGNPGYQLAGGLGIDIGGWNLGASASRRSTERLGSETALMFTVLGAGLF